MGLFWKRKPPAQPPPAQPPAVPLWEYTIRVAFEENPLTALDSMGRVGWELVCVVADEDRVRKMFFKRQLFREDMRKTDEWLAEQHRKELEDLKASIEEKKRRVFIQDAIAKQQPEQS